jgi:ABC-2 type transport system permease protein/sodium transport system permease protein
MMLALLVPIYFVVSNGLMKFLQHSKEAVSVEVQLLFNAAALIITFGLVPLLAAYLGRNRLRTTYRIRPAPLLCYCGAIFLGLGSWAIAHEAFVFADALGIGGLGEDQISNARQMISKMREASPWLLLAVFALTPAVIEELCFRGYLFSALQGVFTKRRTVFVTAGLFGIFHVLTGSALLVERFIPSTLMGLIIGWVACRSGSVLPGMVVHFVHNGLLNLVMYYADRLTFLGKGFDNQAHLPPLWLATAGAIVTVGVVTTWIATRGSPADDAASDT